MEITGPPFFIIMFSGISCKVTIRVVTYLTHTGTTDFHLPVNVNMCPVLKIKAVHNGAAWHTFFRKTKKCVWFFFPLTSLCFQRTYGEIKFFSCPHSTLDNAVFCLQPSIKHLLRRISRNRTNSNLLGI